MTLKLLATGVAAAAIVGGAAAGVTSVAFSSPVAPAVQPVVFGAPLPQTPAPELQSQLVATLNGLQGGGSFSGNKASYIQFGLGRFEGIAADRAFNNASAKGLFPLNFNVADIDQDGPTATANVTATAPNGQTATQSIQFVEGPSPSGWQLTKQSALALMQGAG
ncbi:hypothetical protein FHT40_003245 [Mycolicibacterium sp. BK556]|uniref:hypothetical protein n=1 Tax=Mycobacteriaceae TaxID=1762 RepID=UPI00105CD97B|nr:hypothetical protein [Mycobacterium sp. BK086]MBB3603584.1 hypothetical protein [Mycolicibacterium sp. BK556]MBB3633779.1 hypothetical protein [Mycolicibacterium sp. BK607]MBB3751361.1 hypothetical protein [Mycolicibacterium sp. BK634]TDO11891.1 hypothetical protein EV580_3614 [Mycobacterium sp. BK086]